MTSLNEQTRQIGEAVGMTHWDLNDANCFYLVREHYRIHTYESLTDGWVAAHKDIRGKGATIFEAELNCLQWILMNKKTNITNITTKRM